MSGISERQNQQRQIDLRKASGRSYDDASNLMMIQIGLTVGMPLLGALLALALPDARPYVAALALVLTVVDVAWLDRSQKNLLKLAAKFGEEFDCYVLDLPWDRFAVGARPEPEERERAVRRYDRSRRKKFKLSDWYSDAATEAPIHLARLMCQRANLRYDSQLRLAYSRSILVASFLLLASLVLVAAVQNLTFKDALLVLTPATPILTWSWKEYYRHRDTAAQLQILMQQARTVWDDALSGGCGPDQCLLKAREFQGAIFARRASAPLIFPWVYGAKRAELEDEMEAASYNFLAEFKASQAGQI
ncbi:S-4TM family putative pore-forming effector [Caulobacter segnis]